MGNNSETLAPEAILRGILDGSLTELDAGDATKITTSKLRGHSELLSLSARKATSIGGWLIAGSNKLKTVVMPNANDIEQDSLCSASNLKVVDVKGGIFRGAALAGTKVDTLIIRSTTVARMVNINAISNTPFKNGGGGGTIYIPQALYSHLGDGSALDYKAATNWSTIDGYGTITWAQIEGSQYEHYYADGTPIS